jgi:hypothetical protein
MGPKIPEGEAMSAFRHEGDVERAETGGFESSCGVTHLGDLPRVGSWFLVPSR